MKSKLFIIALMAILTGSCSVVTPSYLPTDKLIDVNEHGSYIKVTTISETGDKKGEQNTQIIRGELIAIDTTSISVLTDKTKQFMVLPVSEIEKFTLQYARPKHYEPSLVLFPLITATHGYFALATLPINLLVTILVTSSGLHAYEYNNKNMTYEKLRMFARFPQGIPPNVDTASLQ